MTCFKARYCEELFGEPLELRIEFAAPGGQRRYAEAHIDSDVSEEQFFFGLRAALDVLERAYIRDKKHADGRPTRDADAG